MSPKNSQELTFSTIEVNTGLKRAIELGAAGVVKEITESGLKGRGGAGFPTGLKWKLCAEAEGDEKFVVCNANEGEPGKRGGPMGDLYCYVRIKPHEFLHRDRNDLIVVVPISFTQAALGTTIEVPSLNSTRGLKIPPGTQYGSIFRIKGQGLPDIRTHRTGDQLVQIIIETPAKLNAKQQEFLREFAKTENKTVFPQSKRFFEKLKKYFGNNR